MKFSNKDFCSKYDQIRSFMRIWSHSLKKSLMENFIFCAVNPADISQRLSESMHISRSLEKGWNFLGESC